MKGNQIINHVVRGEIPDMAQVRSKCLQQAPAKSKMGKAILVAVLTVLVTASVFAAASELGRFRLVNDNEEGTYFESETYTYPFGAQLREYIYTHERAKLDWQLEMDHENEVHEMAFASFDEAASFLGVHIPQNTLLPYEEVSCWVYVSAKGGHAQAILFAFDLASHRTVGMFFSEQRMEASFSSSTILTIEESTAFTYVSPTNGIEALIALSEEGAGTAQFYLGDALVFQVCYDEYADDLVQALKEIVDAFEIE